ncbi:MAG: phage tail protein [Actinobacteria bacterium]|nr:MAG: phage tail protein [Actinomycetota bacterium]
MAEPFLGEIKPVAFNFAPSGWALCDGRHILILQNPELFHVIGTTYGGDGITDFALPDLRGRTPVDQGGGPGLKQRDIGSAGGAEAITLTGDQMPSHSHELRASSGKADQRSPIGNVDAAVSGSGAYTSPPAKVQTMAGSAIGPSGADQPHDNMQPYLTINYIIALQGTTPVNP